MVSKLLNRNAAQLSNLDFIFKELALRVISRLEYLKLDPRRILDCGSGLGFDQQLLRHKYPAAQIVELDLALRLLQLARPKAGLISQLFTRKPQRQLLCADAQALPLLSGSINFCYANLLIPYLGDPQVFIKEMRRVLALGGAFCISGLGVDSFKELRELGLSTYIFPDMHDIGDMLVAAGFSNPVVDTEYITLEYEHLTMLLNEVRQLGCGAANPAASQRGFLGRNLVADLARRAQQPAKLTLEVFVAHGWNDSASIDLPPGYSPIKFQRPAGPGKQLV